MMCVFSRQIVSKGSMDTAVATAAAAQPQIAITHLHAKQEPIPSVANDARAANAAAKWLGK